MTAAAPTTHRLDVPGGNLYYEVRGSGPLLLVIGQPMTSAPFGPLADLLAEDRTVVTYDPHGLGESTVTDPSVQVTPEVQADDLALLVEAVGAGPADVFASSGGAVAGLAFAARHPEHVCTLVAHEPPVTELLPDAAYVRAAVDEIEEADSGDGAGPGAEPPTPTKKQRADDKLFFLRTRKPFTRYEPVVDALGSGSPRVVIAVGEASGEEVAVRSALALAKRLGTPPVPFPGDHAGFLGGAMARLDISLFDHSIPPGSGSPLRSRR